MPSPNCWRAIEVLARRSQPVGGGDQLSKSAACRSTGCRRKVERDGEPILLQPREFRLLEYLMKNAGKVVTRTMLLENVWDYHFDPQTNVIDVHMSRLRGKIDKGHANPLLHTIRGAGYMIRDDSSALAQLWRTTTVRLTAIFILIFVVFSVLLLGLHHLAVERPDPAPADRRHRSRSRAQLQRIDADAAASARSIIAVERLSRQPGPGVYYPRRSDRAADRRQRRPSAARGARRAGHLQLRLRAPRAFDEPDGDDEPPRRATRVVRSVMLDSGLILVVGRDVVERRGFTAIIVQGFSGRRRSASCCSRSSPAWSRRVRVLRRIDTINATADQDHVRQPLASACRSPSATTSSTGSRPTSTPCSTASSS